MLIILRGKPGTGKSTIANALARELRTALIDKDDIKDAIDETFPDFNTGGIAYESMLRLVERNLRSGIDVICDSPLTFTDLYDRLCEMARSHGHQVRVIRLVCRDEVIWQKRLEGRSDLPSHRAIKLTVEMKNAEIKYVVSDECIIDTSHSLETCLNEIRSHLNVKIFV